ncbi:Dsf2p KNAG_0J01070 [Huiozyma naganishii CBS 8797]|uniref:Protein DSF2 n=1 Tax=Huiozyma naganishii (strain ATCC MYA-139 / BCRC 22969 / CBS 8797 / KCTC 17520 / NBRC 10181 / NCYC 3082 / Yp74L-3) TaxID=1071383 RepID=J7S9M3_HUIN7|nr:hypothetical protein KNAG_0J01070 [Kazachstania naganishii CBS 8797]CCK72189.1 hypothetical protein KNAG_0J01070 [Kazachstania naganishii CBS 8797]
MYNQLGRHSPLENITKRYEGSVAKGGYPAPSTKFNVPMSKERHASMMSDVSLYPDSIQSSESTLSVASILTNGRLLDKLELTADDELLLQKILQDEQNGGDITDGQDEPHILEVGKISMPASQFRSLRDKISGLPDANGNTRTGTDDGNNGLRTLLERHAVVKDKTLTTKVEQHYANTSRYSYIVEESELDRLSFQDMSMQNALPSSNSSRNISGRTTNTAAYSLGQPNRKTRNGANGGVNIDHFRVPSSNIYGTRDLNDKNRGGLDAESKAAIELQLVMGRDIYFPTKVNKSSGDVPRHYYHSLVDGTASRGRSSSTINRIGSNGSGTSKDTQFSNYPQLSQPNTQSSCDTETNSPVSSTSTDKQHISSTPSRPRSTSNLTSKFYSEFTQPSSPVVKEHKKKSSLSSLKNLFKTPKGRKSPTENKSSQNSTHSTIKGSSRDNLNDTAYSSSVNDSPSPLQSKNISQYIFPPNPLVHTKPMSSLLRYSNPTEPPAKSIAQLADHSPLNGRERPPFRQHKSFSHIPQSDTLVISQVPSHKRTKSSLIFPPRPSETGLGPDLVQHQVMDEPSPALVRDETSASLNHRLVLSAIDMRKEGKLEASAEKLSKACQKGNKTAFLLYGLALRNGYGVAKDMEKSFLYISQATGIQSLEVEIFKAEVNPFELERDQSKIPEKIEEPLVPALYECGISYLKGFGVHKIDEWKGLKFLEKAASLGHVDSMCLSGIIWSQNSSDEHRRKKDIVKAASWFRLAAKGGADLIGSDWLYKKKYLKLAEKR